MEFIHSVSKKKMVLKFTYKSVICENNYAFEDMSGIMQYILKYNISQDEVVKFEKYVNDYMFREDIPDISYIYVAILGEQLVYDNIWLTVHEKIESYKKNRELLFKDLIRIVECNFWSVTREGDSVKVRYVNKGSELNHLIYVYKNCIVLCKRDGSNQFIYYCDNFSIILDNKLGK